MIVIGLRNPLPGLLSDIEKVAELDKPSSAISLPQNSNKTLTLL